MRHLVTLFLLFFRVAPALADAPPAASLTPPPAASSSSRDPGTPAPGPAGFQLFVHRSDQTGWVATATGLSDKNSADTADKNRACLIGEYRGHPSMPETVNARRRLYWPILVDAACRHGVPVALLDAVVLAESHYRVTAVSRAGAQGLAQLMPETAKELGVVDRFDPRANLNGGAQYLRRMMDMFGSPLLAVAAYNAGPGTVRRAGGLPLSDETLTYVRRVMAYWRDALGASSQERFGQTQLRDKPKAMTMARMTGVASQ